MNKEVNLNGRVQIKEYTDPALLQGATQASTYIPLKNELIAYKTRDKNFAIKVELRVGDGINLIQKCRIIGEYSSEVATLQDQVDSIIEEIGMNQDPPEDDTILDRLDKLENSGKIAVIDDLLSTTSKHAVQNKVVTKRVNQTDSVLSDSIKFSHHIMPYAEYTDRVFIVNNPSWPVDIEYTYCIGNNCTRYELNNLSQIYIKSRCNKSNEEQVQSFFWILLDTFTFTLLTGDGVIFNGEEREIIDKVVLDNTRTYTLYVNGTDFEVSRSIQPNIPIDSTITEDSINPVQSEAIYTALQDKNDQVDLKKGADTKVDTIKNSSSSAGANGYVWLKDGSMYSQSVTGTSANQKNYTFDEITNEIKYVFVKTGTANPVLQTSGYTVNGQTVTFNTAQGTKTVIACCDPVLNIFYPQEYTGKITSSDIGKLVSIRANYTWSFAGTIASVSGDAITVALDSSNVAVPYNFTPLAEHSDTNYYYYDPNTMETYPNKGYLWFPEEPSRGYENCGETHRGIGEGAFAIGVESKANQLGSFVSGDNCIGDGKYSITVGEGCKTGYAGANFGYQNEVKNLHSFAANRDNVASGESSAVFGRSNRSTGPRSFATGGYYTTINKWVSGTTYKKNDVVYQESNGCVYACMFGTTSATSPSEDPTHWLQVNISSGESSFKEGLSAATGRYSHSMGMACLASATGSFSGGYYNKSTGSYSFTFGQNNKASANASFVEGMGNSATAEAQHVQGKYNKELNSSYVDIIGWGASDSQKNIQVTESDGTLHCAGDVYVEHSDVNCVDTAEAKRLAPIGKASQSPVDNNPVGQIGDILIFNNNAYICVDVSGSTYTWKQITQ